MKRLISLCFMLCGFLWMGSASAGGYALRTIQSGDSLDVIADLYGVSVDALLSSNGLETSLLYPGDVIRVPYVEARGGVREAAPVPPPGFRLHELAPGESVSAVMARYGLTLEALVGANPEISSLDRLPAGLELLIPPAEGMVITLAEGQSVLDIVRIYGLSPTALARANAIDGPKALQPEGMLFLPGVEPVAALERLERARAREAEELARVEEARFVWPVHGRLTSHFGRRNLGMGTSSFHAAIDIAAPYGTPVVAARSGTVTFAGWSNRGYGYLVTVRHADGSESWYAHHSELLVREGQEVAQGEAVGRIGSTGISTGPHLHFEIHEGGKPIDPLVHLQ